MTLKQKSKETLDIIASDPKISNTEAYMRTHPTNNRNSARANVAELLAKPSAQIYLENHVNKAKETIVKLLDSDKEDIQFRAGEAILDRQLGKATQRTEVQTTGVTLHLDLTSALGTDTEQQG